MLSISLIAYSRCGECVKTIFCIEQVASVWRYNNCLRKIPLVSCFNERVGAERGSLIAYFDHK